VRLVKSDARQKHTETTEPDTAPPSQTDQSGNEKLLELVKLYEGLREKLIFFLGTKGCHDPEEFADMTLMRVIEQIYAGKPIGDLRHYPFGVARNILKEKYRHEKKVKLESIDEEKHQFAVKSSADESDADRRERRWRYFEECLTRLTEEERAIFLEYYECKGEDRQKMAKRLNITRSALTVRIFHLKRRLEKCAKALEDTE
jgi:RNA polymerase sigma factor (sigma-70 family)